MNPTEGTVIGNRFRLVRELGRGTMGAVWLADHLTLEVRCAVKLIVDREASPASRARFQVEARAIARVRSPHVVGIFDHDVCDDVPYIAMEFLEGEDLRTRLQRAGRLGTNETCRIVSQVARGLAKAHAAGIVHRDVKPENVFLADEDGEEVAKLLDFGIAMLTGYPMLDANPRADSLFGTPEYMSPEQAHGLHEVDHRSDLWSLAVIAYECLTGQLPFAGDTLAELLAQVTGKDVPIPSEMAPDLPSAFDGWWVRAASRNPQHRFQGAQEIADALSVALGIDDPTAFRSPPSAPLAIAPILEFERPALTLGRSALMLARDEMTRAETRPSTSRRLRLCETGSLDD